MTFLFSSATEILSRLSIFYNDDNFSLCKRYPHCLQCTRNEYGSECIGERVEYGLEDSSICSDDADTCGRSLCECDSAFARGKSMKNIDKVTNSESGSTWFLLLIQSHVFFVGYYIMGTLIYQTLVLLNVSNSHCHVQV